MRILCLPLPGPRQHYDDESSTIYCGLETVVCQKSDIGQGQIQGGGGGGGGIWPIYLQYKLLPSKWLDPPPPPFCAVHLKRY